MKIYLVLLFNAIVMANAAAMTVPITDPQAWSSAVFADPTGADLTTQTLAPGDRETAALAELFTVSARIAAKLSPATQPQADPDPQSPSLLDIPLHTLSGQLSDNLSMDAPLPPAAWLYALAVTGLLFRKGQWRHR